MATTHTINNNKYDEIQCCTCGVKFLIPTIVNQNAYAKRVPIGQQFVHGFFCPNGHILGYTKQEEEKLVPKTAGNNIISFLKGKKNDDHKPDPRPAS